MRSEGRRLHGFTVVARALGLARQLVLPAIIGGLSAAGGLGGGLGSGGLGTGAGIAAAIGWIAALLAIPSFAIGLAQWLAFRYRLEDDELIIDSGVLARRRRVIPLPRVQNIDVEQSALQRIFGVAELRLETASGGSRTEARLEVLTRADARALQTELMRRRHQAAPAASAPDDARAGGHETPDSRELSRLSPADLAVAGATSNEAGLIAAGFATAIGVLGDFVAPDRFAVMIEDAIRSGAALGFLNALFAVALLLVGLVVAGWIVSIAAHVVRFHGFTLIREGEDLRREYGLLSRHRSTVPLERIQAVRIEQTLLRRPLGLVALKIETAGAGAQQQRGGAQAEAFVPIARRREVGPLLAEVFPDARFDGVELHAVAPISRRRSFVRLAAPLLVLAGGLALGLGASWLWLLLMMLPAWWLARAQYRARAWARPAGYTLARNGVFTRVTWVVPERKIQTLHLRETPFQRRWHLATLMVDTAAGGRIARVIDLDRDTGLGLLASLSRDAEAARRQALRVASGERASLSFPHG